MSIVRNLSWTFGSRMGAQFTQILFSVFLARLLTPAEYGLIGMLTVLSGFATIVGEAGLNSALVYLDKADRETFSTAFWIQLGINLCFTAIFYFGAGLIADFYQNPSLGPLTRLMSVTFVIQSIGQIQNAILAREMNFKAIAISTYAGALVSSVCALTLALLGFGVWALAWQAISNIVVLLVVTSIYTRWLPHFRFSVPMARKMASYGSYLLLHNGLNYWMRNGDNLLIGKALGAFPLGIYNRAYSLMLLPLQNIGAIVGQVMFPTLSRVREDMAEFRRLYVNSIRLIALCSFPIMGGMSVLARPILLLLYGPQWADAVPVLQILSLVGLFQCIIFPVGWIFTALGKTKEQFHITLVLVPLFFGAIIYGLRFGLLGVTWGYAIWAVISGLLNIYVAGRLIGVSIPDYLGLVARKTVATLVMMAAVFYADAAAEGALGLAGGAVVCVMLGALVYAACLAALRDPDLATIAARGRARFAGKWQRRHA